MVASKPDFLGIGAQKAATNWLWHNLKRHPDVWMPPIKELHYFDRSPRYPSPSYLSTERFATRLFGQSRFNEEFRRIFTRPLGAALFKENWTTFRWRVRHYFGRYNAHWYFSLFEDGAGKLKGEITPSYSILDLPDVRNIKRILPDLKVIFILRNPMDRAWSHVRFNWTTGRFTGIDDLSKVKAFIDSPNQQLRGDYLRTVEIWRSCFPPEQFFIGFYDDIVQNPGKILSQLHDFLGLSWSETKSAFKDKIFTSKERQIPAEVLGYLARKYQPEIERLSTLFGSHTNTWLVEANAILNSRTRPGA